MTIAIRIQNLSKTFNRSGKALSQINLSINEGEIVSLIGPSGSGKSTLMRHISALALSDKADDCDVEVFQSSIQRKGKANRNTRKIRANIGYVFQQFNLVSRLSVMTNVLIGNLGKLPVWRKYLCYFTNEEKKLALKALKRVGMEKFAYQRASTLSGGQQQRVAIARALMQEADIILADEPVASLDPESSRIVMEILRDINKLDGKTVLITLHQVDLARKYCDRAIALKAGSLYYDGLAKDLSDDVLKSLYSSEQLDELHTPSIAQAIEANIPVSQSEKPVSEKLPATATSV